jgi:hypothetical protein
VRSLRKRILLDSLHPAPLHFRSVILKIKTVRKQKKYARMFLLIGLFLLTTNVYSQDSNFYIFLCFGQSNMEGQGLIQTQDKTVDSRFQNMEAVACSNLGRTMGTWYKAVPPLCRCNTGLCPVDYFGRTMVVNLPSNVRVGVINVSVAGCAIELFDRDNYQTYTATAPSWMTSIINEYGGNPYARLVQLAKLAKYDGVIKGILLHQGESNVGDNKWPSKVKGIYDNLMNDLGLDPTQVPLLAGEVVNADQGGACASINSIIATLPRTIPNSYVISSSGCTDTTDNLHFNSAGYREFGKRYATKMLSLFGIVPTAVQGTELSGIDSYQLAQNYPNPFNPSTTIHYQLANSCHVQLIVVDVLGREVATLVNEYKPVGSYTVRLSENTTQLSSGVYYYILNAGNNIQSKKMMFIK